MTRIVRTKDSGSAWSTSVSEDDSVLNLLALYGVTEEWDDTEANVFGQNVRLGDIILSANGGSNLYAVRDLRALMSADVIAPATMREVLEYFAENGGYSVGAPSEGIWTITAGDLAALQAAVPDLHDGNGNGVPGLPAWAEAILT